MNTPTRLLATLVLAGGLHFCFTGFMGSFDYAEPLRRLPWQVSYGVIGLVCIVSLGFLLGAEMPRLLGATQHCFTASIHKIGISKKRGLPPMNPMEKSEPIIKPQINDFE